MGLLKNSQFIRGIAIGLSFVIVILILWNTFAFSQKLKEEERQKMVLISEALKEISISADDINARIQLPVSILNSNKSIPMILLLNKDSITGVSNLDSIKAMKKSYLLGQMEKMELENEPISITAGENTQTIYYGNSPLLNKLKYYPLTLLLILILFTVVIFLLFKTNKVAEQNKLWTGMAKETAHQIGTPLSSLLGWVEILRLEEGGDRVANEIEKDVSRLNTIAERFSKIGSVPILKNEDIVKCTSETVNYLKSRSSNQIQFNFETNAQQLNIEMNSELFSWVIENVVKNAIDSMQGKGEINIAISEKDRKVLVTISDSGKGIPKNLHKKIFTPGYTTKKRGWGLGLSLAKRIIEDYHNGKITVQKSEINKGSTFLISLSK